MVALPVVISFDLSSPGGIIGLRAEITAGLVLVGNPNSPAVASGSTPGTTDFIQSIDLRKTRIPARDGRLHVGARRAAEQAAWEVDGPGEQAADASGGIWVGKLIEAGFHLHGMASTLVGALIVSVMNWAPSLSIHSE